jgi:hypothetical protein
LGIVVMLFITGCSGGGDNDVPPSVTLRGQALVDDVSAAPIAHAECSFVSFGDRLRNRTTADANGMFELMLPSSVQGLLGCYPPGLPNLTLLTFISTDDALPGTTLPEQGVEEVSPGTTVIANIIVQTAPADPQRRKTELLHDLVAQEPDITLLSGAATALFNRMHQMSISEVPFTADSANEGEGEGGGSDGGGVSGEAGDGAEFSPLDDVQCEFVLNLQGDCALEDLLSDGSLDRSDLQAIAPDMAQDAAPRDAFARLFPARCTALYRGTAAAHPYRHARGLFPADSAQHTGIHSVYTQTRSGVIDLCTSPSGSRNADRSGHITTESIPHNVCAPSGCT